MTVARAIFSATVIYAVANALTGGIPILLLPLLTRLLTPAEFGLVVMFTLVQQVVGVFTGLSVHGAVGMRYFDRDTIDFPRFVGTCLVILAVSATIVLVVVAIASPWLEAITEVPAPWLLIAVVASGFAFLCQMQLILWQSAKRPWSYAALRIVQSLLDISVSLFLVLGLRAGWEGRTGGIAVGLIGAGLVALLTLWRGGWLKFPPSREYGRAALAFGLPLVPHVIGTQLLTMTDRLLITNILDVASTGLYFAAVQIGMVVLLVVDAVSRALSPWIIEAMKTSDPVRDRKVVRWSYIYFGAILLFGVLAGIGIPPILGIIVGEQFVAAAPIVPYLTAGQAVTGIYFIVVNYVFYAGRTGLLAFIILGAGVFNVLMSYILLTTQGLHGAGQAFLLAQIVLVAGVWWLAARVRPMPWLNALRPGG